ncbi:AraC family transcriptional regulator [Paucibacter soli]|uniref:AraC family transcriptional regulator n=1 Tax=Paucibacter soli TaxID=3133433 RepID=UPI00309F3C35
MTLDASERLDGPALIALRGDAAPDTEFQLGTREVDWHRHARGQLFCVERGLVHVRTAHGSWLLPPGRAGWIPAGMPHHSTLVGAISGWSLYLHPDACAALPASPRVLGVSALALALVRRAVAWSHRLPLAPPQQRMLAVLLDEVLAAPQQALHLPMPSDRRLVRITHALLQAPDDGRSLAAWAAWAGLSARTLSRLMLAETGLSFAQWRAQAGLSLALERLARGEPVAQVADALGYATPSGFIAMFRRAFGDSPARYFARVVNN